MTPVVSWIITVKNGMPFLPETLASLAVQTFRDFQVLVWDDASTDGSMEELKRWIPDRLPGKIITGQSRSVARALRELVEMADTEFCARIDADDVCVPERLEKQINFLRAHPEVALVGSRVRFIDEKGHHTGASTEHPLIHDDIVHTFLRYNSIIHPTVLFRRATVLAVGNYDSTTVWEDYDLWMRLARQYKLANLPETLVDYRLHSQSLTRQAEKAGKAESLLCQTIKKNGRLLYGFESAEAERLCKKGDSLVIVRAWKMARHLSRTQGGTTWMRMRNTSFIQSLRLKTKSSDVISRFFFAMLDRESNSIRREARLLLAELLKKIPIGARMAKTIRARFQHRQI